MRGLPLGKKFIIDSAKLDIYGETEKYDKPVLILHGDADQLVPLEYSKRYNSVLRNSKLIVVKGAGHSFDSIDLRSQFMTETVSFVKKQC
jgi:pimeloyl-ACP methyl ester carboxylesterase